MKTKLLGLLAFMSLLGFSPASADTIYTYTGNDFTTVTGPYATTDMVTGTIDLSTSLVSFSDDVQSLSTSDPSVTADYTLSINSSGDVFWNVSISSPTGSVITTNNTSDSGTEFAGYGGNSGSPGSWVETVTSATPVPAALPLFAGGLGALGLLGWRRKRKNGAPSAA